MKRQDTKSIRNSARFPRQTFSEFAVSLSIAQNLRAQTVRRLAETELKECKAKKKPYLSENNKKNSFVDNNILQKFDKILCGAINLTLKQAV